VLAMSALIIGTYIPIFSPAIAAAAPVQLEPRSIQMSDSSPSGSSITTSPGDGTDVSYKVTITNANAFDSIVLDFCDNSPIIADTCLNTTAHPGETTPEGMSVAGAALGSGTVNGVNISPTTTCTGGPTSPLANWVVSTPTTYTVELKDTSGAGGSHPICAASTQTFTITGITNPNVAESFYGRIYTYADDAASSYTSSSAPGTYVDYGGIALSTVALITITAKVQESLSFCVTAAAYSTWTTTGDCTDPATTATGTGPPSLTIGTPEGSNVVLVPEQAATGTDTFQLSTNATGGAVIDMHSSNSCGGLSINGGADGCKIEAIGDDTGHNSTASQVGTEDISAAATADLAIFGVQLGTFSDGTTVPGGLHGTGTLNDVAPYNGTGTVYGLDDDPATGVASEYGNEIANTNSAPCFLLTDTINFGATSALTTPAGIYSTNISLIATGTF
jgi:hypothetical protein